MEHEVVQNDIKFRFVVDKEFSEPKDNNAYIFTGGKFKHIFGVQPFGEQVSIPRPNREALERGVATSTEAIIQGSPEALFQIKKIDYTDDGIFVHYDELLFPKKGFPYPEVCQAVNGVKRVLIGLIRSFAKNPLMAIWLLRRKTLKNFIDEFCAFAQTTMSQFYLKPKYYSKTAKEMAKFVEMFTKKLQIASNPKYFGLVISHLFEHDDAYMFRFQDIMNESSVEAFIKDPAKEFNRLVSIFLERESRPELNNKVKNLSFLIRGMFLIPGMRKTFIEVMRECDFKNFQMEECDRYHVLRWDDKYRFLGRNMESRVKEFMKLHKGVIPNFKVLGVQEDVGH